MSDTDANVPQPQKARPAHELTDLAALAGRARIPAEVRARGDMAVLDWILDREDVPGFVRELADEELFLLIKDIGENDSYVLVEHASDDQMGALIDMDAWSGTELRMERWIDWLDRALECNLETGLRFIKLTEPELLELMMVRHATVHPRDLETDTVPDDLDLFETPDGMFYVTVPKETELADRLPQMMKLMWAADADKMRDIFQAARFELASNLEESLLHFRHGRLAELGFPPPTEAYQIFAMVDPQRTREQVRRMLTDMAPVKPWIPGDVASDIAIRGVEAPRLLAQALAQLSDEERANFAQGFTFLVNKVFMARTKDLSRTDELGDAGRHAAALVNLGLGWLADESVEAAADVCRKVWAETMFRTGHSLTMQLALMARRLRARAGVDRDLFLFGTPLDEVMEAASQTYPMYFEGQDTDGAPTWRFFATLQDVGTVAARLEDADVVLSFFERQLGFSPERLLAAPLQGVSDEDRRLVRLQTLLRTGLANTLLTETFSFQPLGEEDLKTFMGLAFEGEGGLSARLTAALVPLREKAPPALARWIDGAVEELVDALGRVKVYDLDPAYASELFLIRRS